MPMIKLLQTVVENMTAIYVLAPLYLVISIKLLWQLLKKTRPLVSMAPIYLLAVIVISNIADLFALTVKAINDFIFACPNLVHFIFGGFAWACTPLKYLAIALLLDYIIDGRIKGQLYQWGYSFSGLVLFITILLYLCMGPIFDETEIYKLTIKRSVSIYVIGMSFVIALLYFLRVFHKPFPHVIEQQTKVIIRYFGFRLVLINSWFYISWIFFHRMPPLVGLYSIIDLTTQTFFAYYCVNKLFELRLVDFGRRMIVTDPKTVPVSSGLSYRLPLLWETKSRVGLLLFTQELICAQLSVKKDNVEIVLCGFIAQNLPDVLPVPASEKHMELFFNNENNKKVVEDYLYTKRMCSLQEITYEQYYHPSPELPILIAFMNSMEADLFIPIYRYKQLIGYILVKNNARPESLYTEQEYVTLGLLAQYMAEKIEDLMPSDKLLGYLGKKV